MTTRPLEPHTDHRPTAPAGMAVLRIGLAASGVLTAAVLLDQVVIGSLETRLAEVYTPYDVPWQGARTLLMAGLLTLGVAGIPGWLVIAHGAARRRGWAAPIGTALFGLGLGFALTLLTAQEYGQTLVPSWLGLLALLPSAVGVVAITQLWRNRRASAHRAAAAGRR